ncbi:MAG: type II toxin-antitoxin system RelE/ParE family toxin [Acidobacteriota bacterium]|nr:type II toxin-antitoxin system RelE/ParE family toxin [Acidobacteriota bacterium]
MTHIRWAPAAADDLESIGKYLREHHPSLTQSTVRKLYDAARSLKKFPNRGRVGQMENTRELVTFPLPYIIVYRVDSDFVHIFRVLHAAEDR